MQRNSKVSRVVIVFLGLLPGCERAAPPPRAYLARQAPEAPGEQAPTSQAGSSLVPASDEPVEQRGEAPTPPPEPARNALLAGPSGTPLRVSSPFRERGPAPMTVLLHGICGNPRITCGWFQEGDMGATWQVCPSGNALCGRDSYQWSTPALRLQEHVFGGMTRVLERYDGRISPEGAVLVGFSLGAFAAVNLLSSGAPRFTGVVLVGASVAPSPEQLTRAKVRRVAFAAGDFDSAAPAMQRAAASLEKRGFEARYVSLGRTGHMIPDSTSAPIGRLIDWARGQDTAEPPR